MNLNVAQLETARAELATLMSVDNHIVSTQSNKPVMGIVQNSLAASFIMTKKNMFFTREKAMQLITATKYMNHWIKLPPPAIMKPVALWTGKQIYSLLFPREINLEKCVRGLEQTKVPVGKEEIENFLEFVCPLDSIDDPRNTEKKSHRITMEKYFSKSCVLSVEESLVVDKYLKDHVMDQDERMVVVKDGELLCGTMCKQTIGSSAGGIVHIMFKDIGKKRTNEFLADCQRMTNLFFTDYGFSVGIGDCMTSQETKDLIARQYRKCEDVVQALYDTYGMNTNDSKVENYITQLTNQVLDQAGRAVQQNTNIHNNSIYAMLTAGSKGTPVNTAFICGLIGQQSCGGKRIHMDDGSRTLPSILKSQKNSTTAHGFCENSYEKGLAPREYFVHAIGGREGLVDTAVKTSETGYIQRKCMKALESVKVCYDGTVRNAQNQIVEFRYGNDGMDGKYIEKVPCAEIMMSNEHIEKKYRFVDEQEFLRGDYETLQSLEIENIIRLRDSLRLSKLNVHQPVLDKYLTLPININRIIVSLLSERLLWPQENDSVISIESLYEKIVNCCQKINPSNDKWFKTIDQCKRKLNGLGENHHLRDKLERQIQFYREKICNTFDVQFHQLLMHIQTSCASKFIIGKYRMTENEVDLLIEKIQHLLGRYSVVAGEMVGPLACTSIVEPGTQMTLNTFRKFFSLET